MQVAAVKIYLNGKLYEQMQDEPRRDAEETFDWVSGEIMRDIRAHSWIEVLGRPRNVLRRIKLGSYRIDLVTRGNY